MALAQTVFGTDQKKHRGADSPPPPPVIGLTSSANFQSILVILEPSELTKKIKSNGAKTVPCGTPLITFDHFDFCPCKTTRCFRPINQVSIHLRSWPSRPWRCSDTYKRLCGTLSNALQKSKYTTDMLVPFSKSSVAYSRKSIKFVKQDLPLLNPCWDGNKSSSCS